LVYTKKRLNIVRSVTLHLDYRLMTVLAALSMHSKQTEPNANIADSMSIWSTLRRALVAMVSIFSLLQRDDILTIRIWMSLPPKRIQELIWDSSGKLASTSKDTRPLKTLTTHILLYAYITESRILISRRGGEGVKAKQSVVV
jgi:hypothetical protein